MEWIAQVAVESAAATVEMEVVAVEHQAPDLVEETPAFEMWGGVAHRAVVGIAAMAAAVDSQARDRAERMQAVDFEVYPVEFVGVGMAATTELDLGGKIYHADENQEVDLVQSTFCSIPGLKS
jgi:hypothetical protein